MIANHVPPQMTISSIEARNADVLLPAFNSLEGVLKAGEVRVASLGQLFPYVMTKEPLK